MRNATEQLARLESIARDAADQATIHARAATVARAAGNVAAAFVAEHLARAAYHLANQIADDVRTLAATDDIDPAPTAARATNRAAAASFRAGRALFTAERAAAV